MKMYVTFGQSHAHHIYGKTLDKDTVAVYDAPNADEGRSMAFELFGRKFCFCYPETEWKESDLSYYPKGYVYL